MIIRNKSGIWGEIYAARYLRDMGCEILASNFRSRFGEADLVASVDGRMLVVEVKTRDENTDIRPMEAVDQGKKERLIKTAEVFMKAAGIDSLQPRFDVCEVWLGADYKPAKINYIENAFET
jgi:putative endonuclease